MKNASILYRIVNLILGIIIIFVPTIISGHGYSEEKTMGTLLTADYILRVVSSIIGLLVISYTIKGFLKKQ
ncbi:hypothetical protein ACFVHQ_19650 [Actinomycetes bacterium NPDC127524]